MRAVGRGVLVGAVALTLLVQVLILAPANASEGTRNAGAEKHIDIIAGFKFSPETVTVEPGTTIIWTNKDGVEHTVTAYDAKIPSGAAYFDSSGGKNEAEARNASIDRWMKRDALFQVTLTVEGVYEYFCVPHELVSPPMVGKITVKASGGGGGGGGLAIPGFEVISLLVAGGAAAALFAFTVKRRGEAAAAGRPRRGFDLCEAAMLTCVVFIVGTLGWMAATAGEAPPEDPLPRHGYEQGRQATVTIIAFVSLLTVPAVWFVLGPASTSPLDEEEPAESASSA
jgi:plastocyanin